MINVNKINPNPLSAQNTAAIEKEHSQQPRKLEFLYGLVRKLYLDKSTLKGQTASNKVPALMQHLQVCTHSLNKLPHPFSEYLGDFHNKVWRLVFTILASVFF